MADAASLVWTLYRKLEARQRPHHSAKDFKPRTDVGSADTHRHLGSGAHLAQNTPVHPRNSRDGLYAENTDKELEITFGDLPAMRQSRDNFGDAHGSMT